MAVLVLVLALCLVCAALGPAGAVFHLAPGSQDEIQLPDNIAVRVNKTTVEGTTEVATAFRKLYRCVAYTSLIASYNTLNEEMVSFPPSSAELKVWSDRMMIQIGSVVEAGIGDDFRPCNNGSEFSSTNWVETATIKRSCNFAHLFRSSCFMSWSGSVHVLSLPSFLREEAGSPTVFTIDSVGKSIPSSKGYYKVMGENALLVLNSPTLRTEEVELNCFVHDRQLSCLDQTSGLFTSFSVPQQAAQLQSHLLSCDFKHCFRLAASTLQAVAAKISLQSSAHHRAVRAVRSGTGTEPSPSPSPTTPASWADLRSLEQHVNMLYQTSLYNMAVTQQKIVELQRVSYHSALSIAKIDDYFLSHLLSHSFSAHFLDYSHFIIKPAAVHKNAHTNCKHNASEIFVSGRYVPRQKDEACYKWSARNVTKISLFSDHHIVNPTFTDIEHSPSNSEIGWSYIMSHSAGFEEASLLRTFGGVQNTGVLDVLSHAKGTISAYFSSLFTMSGIGFSGVTIISICFIIFICRRRK